MTEQQGIIIKGVGGLYTVVCAGNTLECRARGRFRRELLTPAVGDRVVVSPEHFITEILPRKNSLIRPAVANIDLLVVVASQAVPQTDPFLIDRVVSIAEGKGCGSLICINKWDLEPGEALEDIYRRAGLPTLRLSAQTGEGLEALRREISGKVCAFTGNSGVGKSSILVYGEILLTLLFIYLLPAFLGLDGVWYTIPAVQVVLAGLCILFLSKTYALRAHQKRDKDVPGRA